MNLIKTSIEIIKENQFENGAYIASPSLSVYRYSWFRDGSWISYSMLLSGEEESSEKFHDWASNVIFNYRRKIIMAIKKSKEKKDIGDDFIHARYTIDGKEVNMKWGEFQLDGLGVWLWCLSNHIKFTGKSKKIWINSAELVCDYLIELWKKPCYDLWEENDKKIHTSTLASIYGGLLSVSELFPEKKLEETCFEIKKFIVKNLIFENKLVKYNGSRDVDASLIMCSFPFEMFPKKSIIITETISKIIKDLRVTKGLRRYKSDSFYGGGEWIILGCLLGLYFVDTGKIKEAEEIIKWVESNKDNNSYLPEQVNPINKDKFNEWKNKWGMPANPLLWSHAMYIILKNKL